MRIFIAILLALTLAGCIANPLRDTWFMVRTPLGPAPLGIEKGEFDNEDRGYPIFESYEELMDYYMKSYRERNEGI